MSREGKLAKNTIILAVGTFLPKVASYITFPILTGCLTKAEYGSYDLVSVLVSLLLPSITLQIQSAAFRFLIDHRDDEREIKRIVTNIFAFVLPVSVISLVVLYWVLGDISAPVKLWICFYLMADILVNSARQVARGLSNNLDYSLSAIISAVCKIVFVVVGVWYYGLGLLGSVMALCVSCVCSFLFLVWRTRMLTVLDLRLVSMRAIRQMLSYSWPMVPNSVSMWVMRLSDRLVVTMFLGISANATYAVANKIPSLLSLAQNAFTLAWQENATVYSKDKDIQIYYSKMFRTMYDLLAGCLGLLVAATPLIFELLIRGDYSEAFYQIPILYLAVFFYSMSVFLGGIYVAYMATKSVGVTTIAAAICNVVVDLALIRTIGLYAASVSTLVSYVFLFIYRLVDVRKLVKLRYDYAHIVMVFLFVTLECILCYQNRIECHIVNIVLGLLIFFILNRDLVRTVIRKGQQFVRKRSEK